MTKYGFFGFMAFIGGGVLLVFQFLSSVLGSKSKWDSMRISYLLDEKYLDWIDRLSFMRADDILQYIVDMPLFILLFLLGVLFFIMDFFFGRR